VGCSSTRGDDVWRQRLSNSWRALPFVALQDRNPREPRVDEEVRRRRSRRRRRRKVRKSESRRTWQSQSTSGLPGPTARESLRFYVVTSGLQRLGQVLHMIPTYNMHYHTERRR
jgi:hypothetical protein